MILLKEDIKCVHWGRLKSFCLFHEPGRSMVVQKGGKILMTLVLLINICYIVQLFIFIFTFLPPVKFQNVNFYEIHIENPKFLFVVRFLILFPQFCLLKLKLYTEKYNVCVNSFIYILFCST